MSEYYNPKRSRNIFDPHDPKPFKISRSKIDLFVECPRCFYLDRHLGVGRPPGFPFNLNSAVDHLLKKEFDIHRVKGDPHPLMTHYGIDAKPFSHPDLDRWRENFVGVQYLYEPENFIVTGAVDDVWVNPEGELIVADYKATSKDTEITLDAPWQDGYKRQMEVYQWLLRGNGFSVSNTGYFVYANGKRDREAFDGRLEFDITLIPYTGLDTWVPKTLNDIRACLESEKIPIPNDTCDYCRYRKAVKDKIKDHGEGKNN
ncbi:PD-(D/E)XK nuclease family protein [bacterium]|nr:PD-(D/E)XK nuclease family protein [bacterium]